MNRSGHISSWGVKTLGQLQPGSRQDVDVVGSERHMADGSIQPSSTDVEARTCIDLSLMFNVGTAWDTRPDADLRSRPGSFDSGTFCQRAAGRALWQTIRCIRLVS